MEQTITKETIMDVVFRTYGTSKLDNRQYGLVTEQTVGYSLGAKPYNNDSCLWGSPKNGRDTWKDFAEGEFADELEEDYFDKFVDFKIKPNARVLIINNAKMIMSLPLTRPKKCLDDFPINWNRIFKAYDVVYVNWTRLYNNYYKHFDNRSKADEIEYGFAYNYSCNTIMVKNLNAITIVNTH